MAKMVKIPHLDQASYSQAKRFFESDCFESSEKIDGSNISFGKTNENVESVYIQTKKGVPEFGPEAFHELSARYPSSREWHESVIDLQSALQTGPVSVTLDYFDLMFTLNHGLDEARLQIFGEMVDINKPNIVAYEKSRVVILFDANLIDRDGTVEKLSSQEQKALFHALTLCDVPGWTVLVKNIMHVDMETSYNAFKAFESIYDEAITCRKRNQIALKNKEEAKAIFARTMGAIKQDILKWAEIEKSMLGADEIEGIVIRNEDTGQFMKVVDLDDFGARRAEAWAGTDMLKNMRKDLHRTIVRDVLGSPDILILKEKQVQKIQDQPDNPIMQTLIEDISDTVSIRTKKTDFIWALTDYKNEIQRLATDDRTTKVVNDESVMIQKIATALNENNFDDLNERLMIEFLIGPKRLEELKNLVA